MAPVGFRVRVQGSDFEVRLRESWLNQYKLLSIKCRAPTERGILNKIDRDVVNKALDELTSGGADAVTRAG